MICKFFKSGRTTQGARSAINYLLNNRVEQGTAKVFAGDPKLTFKIIKNINCKLKFDSGVLSFKEKIENEQNKQEIIREFEETFFSGIDCNNYNILWVEHSDKGRTELHFIIPRTELSTGKQLVPYFNKIDFYKKDTFQDYINAKYSLSSPHKITKQKLTKELSKNIPRNKIKEKIDDLVKEAIEIGKIKNSTDLKNYFTDIGFKVNRWGKNYIGIEKNGIKIRLKGAIYGNNWGTVTDITEEARAREVKHNKAAEELKQKLNKYRETTAKRFIKLYGYSSINNSYNNTINTTIQPEKMDNTDKLKIHTEQNKIYYNKTKGSNRNCKTKSISNKNKIIKGGKNMEELELNMSEMTFIRHLKKQYSKKFLSNLKIEELEKELINCFNSREEGSLFNLNSVDVEKINKYLQQKYKNIKEKRKKKRGLGLGLMR